ncbi:hypothetical protein [Staphylococcus pettenkoferi]|uniref:hypothetical protein n=1 Tax=Staphylococcus pettenkoferi TaxID=170573 RepID=UPI002272C39E|nr:hypothetical protein [Staphylococcus pettenkoferi]MCY1563859.1 hypothetical protein [Staphylococcus pettenkoferi]
MDREELQKFVNERTELNEQRRKNADVVIKYINDNYASLTEHGKSEVSNWVSIYGEKEIIECTDIAFQQYTRCTVEETFNKVPGIAYNRKIFTDESEREIKVKKHYVVGILKNRFHDFNKMEFWTFLNFFIEDCKKFLSR